MGINKGKKKNIVMNYENSKIDFRRILIYINQYKLNKLNYNLQNYSL